MRWIHPRRQPEDRGRRVRGATGAFAAALGGRGLAGAVLFDPHRVAYEQHGLWENWRHHVGTRSASGTTRGRSSTAAMTVEPGLYAAGLGGFRHSDTVVVRGDGLGFLTRTTRATSRA